MSEHLLTEIQQGLDGVASPEIEQSQVDTRFAEIIENIGLNIPAERKEELESLPCVMKDSGSGDFEISLKVSY